MKMTSLKEERWRMKIRGCNAHGDIDLTRCTLDWWDLNGSLSTDGVIAALLELTVRLDLGAAIADAREPDERIVRGHKRFVVSHGSGSVELGVIRRTLQPDQFTPPLLVLNSQPLVAILKLAELIHTSHYASALTPKVELTAEAQGVWSVVVRHPAAAADSNWIAPAWFKVMHGTMPASQAA